MRRSRLPGFQNPGHVLISARPGKNRFVPGRYVCECGQVFTGMNAYENHRVEEKTA